MKTGFENCKTETIWTLRTGIVSGLMRQGERHVTGAPLSGEAQEGVRLSAMFVSQMDAELMRRGETVSAPPWEDV